jgi:hypothetical protein
MADTRQTTLKELALGLVLIGLLVAGGIAAIVFAWRAFADLDPGIAAALVTAAATVLLSVSSLILSKRWEQQREIQQQHRKRKLPIYEEFMAT